VPIALDEYGEATDSTREELALFFEIVDEIMTAEGESRPSILREVAKLRQEHLGDSKGKGRVE
jgi:predicted house-cleaning noncanonical NTP pyrophosphatase (MazG superfamily)